MWQSPVLLLLLLLVPALAHAEGETEKLKKLEASIEASQQKTKALSGALTKEHSQLADLQEQSRVIAAQMQQAEQRLNKHEKSLATVRGELAVANRAYQLRQDEYSATVRSLLRMRQMPASAILSRPEDLQQLMQTAAALEITTEALARHAADLKARVALLEALQKRAENAQAALSSEQKRWQSTQASLRAQVTARQVMIKRLQSDYAREQTRVRALSQEARSVQELIDKLATAQRASARAPLRPMTRNVGSLRAPVAGSVLHRFGERKNENETFRGMVFRARPYGTVVAPYDGEVVFTGPFRDYGDMVLIRHGNGYISLLAGLGQIEVVLNQDVKAGEPLGNMGGTGREELYVELREKSKPIDPARWFAKLGSRLQ
ncbi:MAG: murein hydrolase activator EnvC family protein [Alphaproteobacteria bacterium]|jgi:septal ring factor EnvC (AmiA/AmiB activator)